MSKVLCDCFVPFGLRGTFHETIIKPTIIYGLECWVVGNNINKKLTILRWKYWDGCAGLLEIIEEKIILFEDN